MSPTSTASSSELWQLALHQPQIDPSALAAAIERELQQDHPDFRTRLLVRDSINALTKCWGESRTQKWIIDSPVSERIDLVLREELGAPGFSTLSYRLMERTKAETVLQFLRELGTSLTQPTSFVIGGSIALILPSRLARHTEDIDIVDEVPGIIRDQHDLLESLTKRYGLRLAHFQSHYLPAGWETRVKFLGDFGLMHVSLVDEYDIMLGKLFSKRDKDRDDLRVLARELDKSVLADRLSSSGGRLLGETQLRQNAAENWYIVYGEQLPA